MNQINQDARPVKHRVGTVQAYVPPAFDDDQRLQKIHAVLPEVDAIYKAFAESHHVPGYAYGVLVDGQLIYSSAGGFIDREAQIPASPHSFFRIASMTKSLTAMAVLKLRDENRLRLDDPIHSYIPEIKDKPFIPDAPEITIRDLLTHCAGIPTDDPWADRKLHETADELLALLNKGLFFAHVPGTAFEYSNLGYALLGRIVNQVSGVSCADYIDETLRLPGILWDPESVPPAELAQGYRWTDGSWKREEMLRDGVFGPIGGLFASVESFSRYIALHMDAWPAGVGVDQGPVKKSSIREMQQPLRFMDLVSDTYPDGRSRTVVKAYGYGLIWQRDDQRRVFVGHSGGLPGFGSNWWFMPDYGIGVVLLANVTYAPALKVNFEVLDKIVEAARLKPRQLSPSSILVERKNALTALLPSWEGAEASGIFADNFFPDHPISTLRQETEKLFAVAGDVVSISDVIPDHQLRGHFIVKGTKASLRITLSLTPENPPRIQQYEIKEEKID